MRFIYSLEHLIIQISVKINIYFFVSILILTYLITLITLIEYS